MPIKYKIFNMKIVLSFVAKLWVKD